MTLHEAILQILRTHKQPQSPEVIANAINKTMLYQKADRTPVTPAQIILRSKNYPRLFELSENDLISLKINPREILSYYYGDLNEILNRRGSNNTLDTLKFFFYLRTRKSSPHLLNYSPVNGKINSNSFIVDELLALNQTSALDGVFDSILKTLKDSDIFEISDLENFIQKTDFSDDAFDLDFFGGFYLETLIKTLGKSKKYISLPDFASRYIFGLITNDTSLYFPFGELEAFKWMSEKDYDENIRTKIILESQDNDILDFAKILKLLSNKNIELQIQKSHSTFNSIETFTQTTSCFSIVPIGRKVAPPRNLNLVKNASSTISYETLAVDTIAHSILSGNLEEAYLIVPEGFLFSSKKGDVQFRASMLNLNILKAVISLPSKLFYPISGLKTSLIILSKKNNRYGPGVLFIDAKELNEDNLGILINKTKDILQGVLIDENFSVTGDMGLIASTKYSLTVNTYLGYRNQELLSLLSNEEFTPLIQLVTGYFKGKHIPNAHISNNPTDIPLIRVNNLTEEAGGLRINLNSIEKFVDKDYAISDRRFYIPENSILLATHGMALKATLFNQSSVAFINTNIICLQPDTNRVLPEYMLIQFKQNYFQDQIETIRNTNLIPYITIGELLKLRIKVPDKAEQEREVSAYKSRVLTEIEEVIRAKEESSREGELKIFRAFKHELGNRSSELNNYLQTLQIYLKKVETEHLVLTLDNKIGDFPAAPSVNQLFENIYSVQDKISAAFRAVQNVFDFQSASNIKNEINLIEFVQNEIKIYKTHFYNLDCFLVYNSSASEFNTYIDKNQFHVLIENFIRNVEMHGINGKEKVNLVIALEYSKENNRIFLHFMNDGRKLPEGFTIEDFISFGLKSGPTANTGIGGYLCKLIVDNHKGVLRLGNNSDWIKLSYSKHLRGEKHLDQSFEPRVHFVIELSL